MIALVCYTIYFIYGLTTKKPRLNVHVHWNCEKCKKSGDLFYPTAWWETVFFGVNDAHNSASRFCHNEHIEIDVTPMTEKEIQEHS